MGRKRQIEGVGPEAYLGSQLGGATGGPPVHQFAPGNPYLVGLLPTDPGILNAVAADKTPGGTDGPREKGKHVVTQDSWRLVKVEPEVQDLADHFGLDERITGKLQEALDRRGDPGGDLEVMWEILDEARNPPGLTMIKVKEMLDGTFRSGEKADASVKALAVKFHLDERATYKLSEVLATKPNKKEVLKLLDIHLSASNNPSALVMLRLADLRKDVPLGEVPYGTKGYRDRPYMGSYDRDGNKIGYVKKGTEQTPEGDKNADTQERPDQRPAGERSGADRPTGDRVPGRGGERGDRGGDRGGGGRGGGPREHRGDGRGDRADRDRDRGRADRPGGDRANDRQDRARSRDRRSRSRGRRRSRSRGAG